MKKLFALALAILCVTTAVPLAAAAVPAGPTVSAVGAVLMEKETGRVLYEQNAHEALPPASVTKVMSLLLVGEAIKSGKIALNDMVITSDHAASMGGSQIYLEPGEQMSVEDMLKAVVLGSANDAVVALGEHIAGSEDAFVAMMNAKAAELGMKDTTFRNACGLDEEGHVTSAYDIALMSRALLLEFPDVRKYATTWMDSVRGGEFQLANTNKMVRTYNGITGLKTGFTSVSGHCLAASAERDGMELVCGILKSPSSADRFAAAKMLLDYGFANYTVADIYPDGTLAPIAVNLGKQEYVQPELRGGNRVLLDKGALASIEREMSLAEIVEAPVAQGQKLGEMLVRAGGEEILRVDIVAADAVEKLGFFDVYTKLFERLVNK